MANNFQMDTKKVAINSGLIGSTNQIFREQSAKKGAELKREVVKECWIKLRNE